MNTVIKLTGMVRKRLKPHIRLSTVGLLTGYVNFRDILNGLIRDKVFKADDFKWQMQFKFEIKNLIDVVKNSAYTNTTKMDTNKLEVDSEVFGN
jgi:hypothetical protein